MAAKCRQIWNANRDGRIPYGFGSAVGCFDPVTLEYLYGPSQFGLTCATFVLGVFSCCGIELVKCDSWPAGREDDVPWQRSIVEMLKSQNADPEHIRHIEADIGTVRVRPEEVASAATDPAPSKFDDVIDLSMAIVARLRSQHLPET
jgi:hypothetical protein